MLCFQKKIMIGWHFKKEASGGSKGEWVTWKTEVGIFIELFMAMDIDLKAMLSQHSMHRG